MGALPGPSSTGPPPATRCTHTAVLQLDPSRPCRADARLDTRQLAARGHGLRHSPVRDATWRGHDAARLAAPPLRAPGTRCVASISLDGGLSATELADEVVRRGEALEVKLDPDPEHHADDRPTGYHTAKAEAYLQALEDVDGVFAAVRGELSGDVSGVQLWPHHFDLSFAWHGKEVTYQSKDGGEKTGRALIGIGFSAGDASHPDAYLYANPWPFDDALVERALPGGASWYTDQWKGASFPMRTSPKVVSSRSMSISSRCTSTRRPGSAADPLSPARLRRALA